MTNNHRLQLTWVGKDEQVRLEPRILIENTKLSYYGPITNDVDNHCENILINGDNLLALKALESGFIGKVKCVYIDPPFNTKQAFLHYEDGIEHSIWLTMMRDRLEIIKNLMSTDGSMFIHIDDNELGYLLVLADEIFGRSNRVGIITFKQSSVSGPKAQNPGIVTTNNYILYYVKDKACWSPNRVYVPTTRDDRYSKVIENFEDDYRKWKLIGLKEYFLREHQLVSWEKAKERFAEKIEEKLSDFVIFNSDRVVRTARVAPKDVNESAREALTLSMADRTTVYRSQRDNKDDYYFYNGEQLIFYRSKVRLIDNVKRVASPLTNLWDDLLSNNLHNEGGVSFPNGKKPEALIKRCLELSTNHGDIVLDGFAGSGTTGAVAHKMKRRWIMIEMGEHCHTHILPRIRKIIDGDDESGITEAVGWKNGGGFRYYRMAPSLLEKDQWGNWVISKDYNAVMLAEAMCKHMGFTYAPSQDAKQFWRHGHSTESDFIFVTTASLSHDQLKALSYEVGPERTLLVCCKAFKANAEEFENLTIKKIPQVILSRCEWGRDDYSLAIPSTPQGSIDAEADVESVEPSDAPNILSSADDATRDDDDQDIAPTADAPRKRGRPKKVDAQPAAIAIGGSKRGRPRKVVPPQPDLFSSDDDEV